MTKKEAIIRVCLTYALLDNIAEQTGKYLYYANLLKAIGEAESTGIDSSIVKIAVKFEKALKTNKIKGFSDIPEDAVLTIIVDNLVALIQAWDDLGIEKYTQYAKQLKLVKSQLLNYWKYKFKGNEEEGFMLIDNIIEELCK